MPTTVTTPTYTGNTANNVIASATLAASGTSNANVDYSAVFEAQIHVLRDVLGFSAQETAESLDFFLPTGKYNIKLTNLDATNAIVAGVTGDTIANITTT